jgi:hypothetical protein
MKLIPVDIKDIPPFKYETDAWQEQRKEYFKAKGAKKSKERYATLKRFLTSVKLTCGCIDCGYRENVATLQFDHTRDKLQKVGQMITMKRAVAELEKCEVRCANCHAIKTAERYSQ